MCMCIYIYVYVLCLIYVHCRLLFKLCHKTRMANALSYTDIESSQIR